MYLLFFTDDEPALNSDFNTTQFSTPTSNSNLAVNSENENAPSPTSLTSSDTDEEKSEAKNKPQSGKLNEESKENFELKGPFSLDKLKQIEKSDSAIEDTTMSPE